MKSNTILKHLSVCLITLLSVHQFASARGGSSGSGNNGEGFSLSNQSASRTSLPTFDTLTEIFEKSKGRIPDLTGRFTTSRIADLGTESLEVSAFNKGSGIKNTGSVALFARDILNYGPLFNDSSKIQSLTLMLGALHLSVSVAATTDSLEFFFGPDRVVEMRQLNNGTVIYTKYAVRRFDGKVVCMGSTIQEVAAEGVALGTICAVGYTWN